MNYMIDNTNHAKIKLTEIEYETARALIESGSVRDNLGDILFVDEVTDGDKDLVVDEAMYDGLKAILFRTGGKITIKPHKNLDENDIF